MKKFLHTLSLAGATALLLSAPQTLAAGGEKADKAPEKPARSGAELSTACAACHGAEGVSISDEFPNLAGQYRSYLLHALKGYRSGERNNAVMASFVKGLTDQELENLADFYSSKSGLGTLPGD